MPSRSEASHSIHVRIAPAQLAELDRRRKALPIEASRNAYAGYLLNGALGGAADAPVDNRPALRRAAPMPRRPISNGGARLLAARTAAGLTLRALGSMLGINSGTLSRVERGGAMPAEALAWVERQEAAAEALGPPLPSEGQ